MKMEQSVPKRLYRKIQKQGIHPKELQGECLLIGEYYGFTA
jgi:hypothetical protein